MSQPDGYATLSKTFEKTKNTDTSSSCYFAEKTSKLRNDLVEIFHDLRDEIINFKNMIKKLQDENPQLKESIAKLQHTVIILETATNSVEQYDQRNKIEITGISDNT